MLHNDDNVVEHGGNVRGGCAQLGMFPEENLGFVLLMNVSASTLQPASISIVRNAMLGEIQSNAESNIDFAPFVGEYTGNFGPFNNETFTVQEKGAVLHVVPYRWDVSRKTAPQRTVIQRLEVNQVADS